MVQRCLLPGKNEASAPGRPASGIRTRILRGIAGAMALGMMSSTAMAASLRCADPEDQAMFEVSALKTELMVVAVTCKDTDSYNAFIQRYRDTLASNDKAVIDHFTGRDKRAGQRTNDSFVTNLANSRTQEASRIGADFCSRNTRLFKEVMALSSSAELVPYAAGKDLIPTSMGACPLEVSATPAPAARSSSRARR